MSVATGRERKSRRELVCIKSILRQRLANLRNAYLSVFYGAGSIAGIRSNVVKRNLNLFFQSLLPFLLIYCMSLLRHVLLELFLTAFKWITKLNQLSLIRCKDFKIIILFFPNPSLLASEDSLSCYNWLNRNKVVVNKFVVGSAKVSPEIVQNDLLKTDTSHQNNLKFFSLSCIICTPCINSKVTYIDRMPRPKPQLSLWAATYWCQQHP